MAEAVYLTKARAQKAIELAEPTIVKMMMDNVATQKSIHIVILGLDGQILHEQTVGPNAATDMERIAPCIHIARSKAQIHFRTGRPSAEIQSRRPYSLLVGDTIYGGSADHEGLIVAASGVQGYYDETIAATVAAILWGLCMQAQAAHMAKTDKSPLYSAPL